VAVPFQSPDWSPIAPQTCAVRFELDTEIVVVAHYYDYAHVNIINQSINNHWDFTHFLIARKNDPFAFQDLIRFARKVRDEMSPGLSALQSSSVISYLTEQFRLGRLRVFSLKKEKPLGDEDDVPVDPDILSTRNGNPEDDVTGLSNTEKFGIAIRSADIAGEARKSLAAFLEPANIALMATALGAIAAVSATGVGAVALMAVGWAAFGWAIFDIASKIWSFISGVMSATVRAGLTTAGRVFASLLILLVELINPAKVLAFFKRIVSRLRSLAGPALKVLRANNPSPNAPKKPEEPQVGAGKLTAARRAAGAVPDQVVNDMAKFMGQTPAQVRKRFESDFLQGVHFDEAVGKFLKKHPDMSEEDAYYILTYTTNYYVKDLNAVLRGDPAKVTPEAAKLRDGINSALEKLPPVSGKAYRGISPPDLAAFDAKYKSGSTILDGSFLSASPKAAEAYQGTRNLVIESTSARDISDLAMDVQFPKQIGQAPTSSEVVFPAGSVMDVVDVDTATGTIWLVE